MKLLNMCLRTFCLVASFAAIVFASGLKAKAQAAAPGTPAAAVVKPSEHGRVGLGTWVTLAEFKDVKVTKGDSLLYKSDFAKSTDGWQFGRGDWTTRDGVLVQASRGVEAGVAAECRAYIGDVSWSDYTLELKAKKTGGNEGFLIMFNVADDNNLVWLNIGGWGNSRTVMETMVDGVKTPLGSSSNVQVELNRWYDIRIEVNGGSIRCSVDGKIVSETPSNPHGRVGVGTWSTSAEFKDVKVAQGDKVLYQSDFSKGIDGWRFGHGTWEAKGGSLVQTSLRDSLPTAIDCRAVVGDPSWTDYTLSLKARKIDGVEGFLILFDVQDSANYVWWNLGGWKNTRTTIEASVNGGKVGLGTGANQTIEANKWYDIRVETRGQTIRCYLENQLVIEAVNDRQMFSGAVIPASQTIVNDSAPILSSSAIHRFSSSLHELLAKKQTADALALVESSKASLERNAPENFPQESTSLNLKSFQAALDMTAATIKDLGQNSQTAWTQAAQQAANLPEADAEKAYQLWGQFAAQWGSGPAAIGFAKSNIPIPARNALGRWLLISHLPGTSTSRAQAESWFNDLMMIMSKDEAASMLCAVAMTQWMDSHQQAATADSILEKWMGDFAEEPAGPVSLQLRLLTLSDSAAQNRFLEGVTKKYGNQRVGRAAIAARTQNVLSNNSALGGLRTLERAVAPELPTVSDSASSASRILALIRLANTNLSVGGLGRPAAKVAVNQASGSVALRDFALGMKLYEEFQKTTSDVAEPGSFKLDAVVMSGVLYSLAESIALLPEKDRLIAEIKVPDRPQLLATRTADLLAVTGSSSQAVEDLRPLIAAYVAESATWNPVKAKESYRKLAGASKGVVSLLAQSALMQLALEQNPPDLVEADAAFGSYVAAGGRLSSPTLGRWAMRRLLQVVSKEPREKRIAAWDKGIETLASQSFFSSEPVIAELAANASLLRADPDFGLHVLSDLVLAARTAPVAYRIQEMRIQLLKSSGNLDAALAAARLNVWLSLANEAGPFPAAARYADVLTSAGQAAEAEKSLSEPYIWITTASTAPANTDKQLAELAKKQLGLHTEDVNSSQHVLWQLYAGENEFALTEAFSLLLKDPTRENAALTRVCGVTVDGDLRGYVRTARWMADKSGDTKVAQLLARTLGEKDATVPLLPQRAMADWATPLNRWRTTAINDNQLGWSALFGLIELDSRVAPATITPIIDRILVGIPPSKPAPDTAVGILRGISGHAATPQVRRLASLRIVNTYYDRGMYDKVTEELDRYNVTNVGARDVQFGLLGAQSLIQRGQLEDALKVLSSMTQWEGVDEDLGRVQFLIGWLNLQQDRKEQSLVAFKTVVEKYGKSTFAAKAAPLIKELQSGN